METVMAQEEMGTAEMEKGAMFLPHPLRSRATVTGIRLDPATKTHNRSKKDSVKSMRQSRMRTQCSLAKPTASFFGCS